MKGTIIDTKNLAIVNQAARAAGLSFIPDERFDLLDADGLHVLVEVFLVDESGFVRAVLYTKRASDSDPHVETLDILFDDVGTYFYETEVQDD